MIRTRLRSRLRAGVGGGVAPTTSQFTYAQSSGGIFGPTDVVTDATKRNMTTNGAGWAGVITGTDATIVTHRVAGDQTNQIVVSVDGGAFTAPAYSGSGGIFPLFAGKSQGDHFVVVKPGGAYANQVYIPTSGNVVAVTGVNPAIDAPSGSRIQPLDGNALCLSTGYAATAIGGNFTPSPGPANLNVVSQTASPGSCTPSVRFRAAANEIQVIASCQYVFVSVNGAAPTMYNSGVAFGTTATQLFRITGLGGTAATYTVWPSWEQGSGTGYGVFSVACDAAFTDCGTKRKIHQYGDSITFGAGTSGAFLDGGSGAVDVFEVGAALSLTPGSFGIAGNTTNQLGQRFGWDVTGTTRTGTGILANIVAGASDVAVLATGRNDQASATAMSAQNITDYTNCVNALIAIYGKVICRGVLPGTGFDPSTYNAGISAIVTGLANANVTYVNPNAWTFTLADGTHPNRAGYTSIAAYEKTAYAGLI